jgi:transcription termination factor NusA
MTEAESSEKRQKEFVERSEMFQQELDVDETLAQLLVAEGFSELEEVAYVALEEIAGIEGLDDELAEELQSRAAEALERKEEASRNERRELGVEDALAELPHLTEAMLVTLGKAGVKTLDDLADLATDELIQKGRTEQRRGDNRRHRVEDKPGILAVYGLNEEQGNEIIMAARAHWFDDLEPEIEGEDAVAAEAAVQARQAGVLGFGRRRAGQRNQGEQAEQAGGGAQVAYELAEHERPQGEEGRNRMTERRRRTGLVSTNDNICPAAMVRGTDLMERPGAASLARIFRGCRLGVPNRGENTLATVNVLPASPQSILHHFRRNSIP